MQTTIYGRDGVELYHLADDPREQHNVADCSPRGGRADAAPSSSTGSGPSSADAPDPMTVGHRRRPAGGGPAQRGRGRAGPAPSRRADRRGARPPAWHSSRSARSRTRTTTMAQRFAPGHNGRLRGARGVLAGAILVVAAALLGLAVNDVLLADPALGVGRGAAGVRRAAQHGGHRPHRRHPRPCGRDGEVRTGASPPRTPRPFRPSWARTRPS